MYTKADEYEQKKSQCDVRRRRLFGETRYREGRNKFRSLEH